jgi:primosomal protein N' (replication factor Y)
MIARVVIDSPLPQLDRLFDYAIPQKLLGQVAVGVRVRVQFGRSKNLLDAFVVELVEASDFAGELSPIAELVSAAPILDPNVFALVRAVADRQASTASDVLRLAIPDRSVAVEKKWLESNSVAQNLKTSGRGTKQTALVDPHTSDEGPVWATQIRDKCVAAIQAGKSVIVAVPDFRDQAVLLEVLNAVQIGSSVVNYTTDTQKSKRYAAFLSCLGNACSIVVGSRSAIYAPVRNLGEIIVWDDGDPSHQEPTSPYSHTREVALMRQRLQECNLLFLGHSRSTEVSRLVSLKFLEDVSTPFKLPRIANTDTDIRVDSMAWKAIREGLETGPVLVQVAAKGTATSVFCATCDKRAECGTCNGPLWIDERNYVKCRWCNAVNMDFRCQACAGTKLKQGSAGATRTIAEFGRAFPGVKLVEATAELRSETLKPGKFLVVATPGAEPRVMGGYSAVVILDANRAINRDTLRATEDAVRTWSNAIALGSADSRSVLVGVTGTLANKFSLWSHSEMAQREYATRAELRFPPAIRLASIGASKELIQTVQTELANQPKIEVLGPLPVTERGVSSEWRLLIKYEYSDGSKLAESLKALSLKLSAGQQRVSAKSGRAMRPIRIKMDDVEVI